MTRNIKNTLLVCLPLCIIIYMTVVTWGTLEKSAVDPQVITAAIQEMIDAHEANPSAHLGIGESLEQHKTNEIIDHPANSVVPDKNSASQPVFSLLFGDTVGFIKAGNVANALGLLTVRVLGNAVSDSSIYTESVYIDPDSASKIQNGMLQFSFQYSKNFNVATIYAGLGIYDFVPDGYTSQIFLRIANGVLSLGVSNGSTVTYSEISAALPTGKHTFRIITNNFDNTADIYFDDVLFSRVNIALFTDRLFTSFGVYSKKIGGTLSNQNTIIRLYYLSWANTQISS